MRPALLSWSYCVFASCRWEDAKSDITFKKLKDGGPIRTVTSQPDRNGWSTYRGKFDGHWSFYRIASPAIGWGHEGGINWLGICACKRCNLWQSHSRRKRLARWGYRVVVFVCACAGYMCLFVCLFVCLYLCVFDLLCVCLFLFVCLFVWVNRACLHVCCVFCCVLAPSFVYLVVCLRAFV